MGTEYLMIILLWCQAPNHSNSQSAIYQCRRDAIRCVRDLNNFTTDDVLDKCLLK